MKRTDDVPTVLIVDADPDSRNRVANWLSEAGYDVLGCGGPDSDHHCPGLSHDGCPLACAADIVVMDLSNVREVGALRALYESRSMAVVGLREPSRESTLSAVGRAAHRQVVVS